MKIGYCSLACMLALSLVAAVPAAPDLRKDIQGLYDKSCRATQTKYVDGALSLHGDDYEAFDPEGKKIDLRQERAGLAQLFERALTLNESIFITSFKVGDSSHVRCETRDILNIVLPEKLPNSPSLVRVTTLSQEDWIKGPQGWQLRTSRALRQSTERRALTSKEMLDLK